MCSKLLVLLLVACIGARAANGRQLTATASARASALVVDGGSATATASCTATNGNTANCESDAVSGSGGDAVAQSQGTATKGDVDARAIAVALENSDTTVLASAVADGAGTALATAIADNVQAGGQKRKVTVTAIAKVIAEEGCDKVQSALAEAFAIAQEGDYGRNFADAFDVDVKVAECLYPSCSDDRWHCCKGNGKNCDTNYSIYKKTPRTVYACSECGVTHCMCP